MFSVICKVHQKVNIELLGHQNEIFVKCMFMNEDYFWKRTSPLLRIFLCVISHTYPPETVLHPWCPRLCSRSAEKNNMGMFTILSTRQVST